MYQISVPQKFIVSILFILQYIYVSVWNYSLFFSLSLHCFIQSIHVSDRLCPSAFPAESLKTWNKNKVFSKLPLNRWQNVAGKMVTSSWIYDSLLLNRWLPTAEQMMDCCATATNLLLNCLSTVQPRWTSSVSISISRIYWKIYIRWKQL